MPWARLDDGFDEHPKVDGLLERETELDALAAIGLFVLSITRSARRLTDGEVTDRMIAGLAPKHGMRLRKMLRDVGFYDGNGRGSVRIHDYLSYNPSRAEVQEKREAAAARQRRSRSRARGVEVDFDALLAQANGICYLCAKPIKTKDLCFDHVIPSCQGGADTEENLRPTHRRCNSIKSDRRPTECHVDFPNMVLGLSAGVVRPAANGTGDFTEQKVLELHRATRSGDEGLQKIRRTIRSRRSSTGDIVAATEAAQGPGVHDRLAVALSTLTKRKPRKAA